MNFLIKDKSFYKTFLKITVALALQQLLPEVLTVQPTDSGIHLVCWLKGAWTEQRFIEKCAEADLAVQPLSRYCQSPYAKAAVLFGYAAHAPDEIRSNIAKLAQRIKMNEEN